MKWLDVKMVKPACSRDPDALGTLVLVWPRNPVPDVDGQAYYGCRVTGKPAFYKFGRVLDGVTHWMPMPAGPRKMPCLERVRRYKRTCWTCKYRLYSPGYPRCAECLGSSPFNRSRWVVAKGGRK